MFTPASPNSLGFLETSGGRGNEGRHDRFPSGESIGETIWILAESEK